MREEEKNTTYVSRNQNAVGWNERVRGPMNIQLGKTVFVVWIQSMTLFESVWNNLVRK